MTFHAKLSPSGADRWMTCTASVSFTEDYKETESEYAVEGTAAHELSERVLTCNQGVYDPDKKMDAEDFQDTEIEFETSLGKRSWSPDQSMIDYVQSYVDFVRAKADLADDPSHVWIEDRVHYDDYVPEGSGTADAVVVYKDFGKRVLHVIDLKYGKGVEVDPTHNRQALLYALGALEEHSWQFDNIDIVRVTIFQPRVREDGEATWETRPSDVYVFAEKAKKAALDITNGDVEFKATEKGCKFCPAKANCKALAKYNLDQMMLDFDELDETDVKDMELTEKETVSLFLKAKEIKNWLEGIEKKLLNDAVHKGAKYDGLKLVKGRTTRTWKNDEAETVENLALLGIKGEAAYEKKLLTPAKAEKLLDKVQKDNLKEIVKVNEGKLTLVSQDDKRPEVETADVADDFD